MPYGLKKSGKGYRVVTKGSGRAHSKKAMSKGKASRQMRAMYAAMTKKHRKGTGH
jgi:hypothetical protein